MKNKIFYLIVLILTISNGQVNTYSPYSYFGIGQLYHINNTTNISMAGLGVTLLNQYSLNLVNPSSYSSLKQTSFDIGFSSSFLELTKENLNQKNFVSSLSNLSLGFPISEKIGVAFALLPYSRVGYNVVNEDLSNDETGLITSRHTGSGGLNRFLFGVGTQIIKSLSIGINFNYIFGPINRENDIFTQNSNTEFKEINLLTINDGNFDFAMLFTHLINDYNIHIGTTFCPKTTLKGNSSLFQHTYITSGNYESFLDTIMYLDNNAVEMTLPSNYSVGIGVGLKNNWFIGLDYKHTKWDEYHITTEDDNNYLHNQNQFIVGGWVIPKETDIHNYFNRVKYRFGISYTTGYLNLGDFHESGGGNDILQDLSISTGLALPINKVKSKINLGLRYGLRDSFQSDLNNIKEKYFDIYFSITLNEKWFKKRKIE